MTHRIYVLEKFRRPRLNTLLTGAPAEPIKYFPVECYADKRQCEREAARKNTCSPVWEYRRRPGSLKLYGVPGAG